MKKLKVKYLKTFADRAIILVQFDYNESMAIRRAFNVYLGFYRVTRHESAKFCLLNSLRIEEVGVNIFFDAIFEHHYSTVESFEISKRKISTLLNRQKNEKL